MSCKYIRNPLDEQLREASAKQYELDKEMKVCFEIFMEDMFPAQVKQMGELSNTPLPSDCNNQYTYWDMLRAYRNGWATGIFRKEADHDAS